MTTQRGADQAFAQLAAADAFFHFLHFNPEFRSNMVRELTITFNEWKVDQPNARMYDFVSLNNVLFWWNHAKKIAGYKSGDVAVNFTDGCWQLLESATPPMIDVVENERQALEAVHQMLNSNNRFVAVDCEGFNLGTAGGELSLIQMCCNDLQVYVFNLRDRPELMGVIRGVLEEPSVVKVFHGIRHDRRALENAPWNIALRNTVDSQQLFTSVFPNEPKNIGLSAFSERFRCGAHPLKSFFQEVMKQCSDVFIRTPLPHSMVSYAGLDAWFLFRAFAQMGTFHKEQLVVHAPSLATVRFQDLCTIPMPAEDVEALRRSVEALTIGSAAAPQHNRPSRPVHSGAASAQSSSAANPNRGRPGSGQGRSRGPQPLTEGNLAAFDRKQREVRQFGCGPCKYTWWKLVDRIKPVSRCTRCRIRYDPVPVDQQFGYGRFVCECGHTWTNMSSSNTLQQKCFACGKMVSLQKFAEPPSVKRASTSGLKHSCAGCATGACRFRFIPSIIHDSTGSTNSTSASVEITAEFVETSEEDALIQLAKALKRLNTFSRNYYLD